MAEHSYDTPTKSRPKPGPGDEHAFPNIQSGRYKFISVIGYGGAGTVYRAHDTSLDKEVAIKKLHSATDDQAIRFQREAKLAGALNHENVMSALDFGVTDRNEPYLVLDYVSGESLASYIKREGRRPVEESLKIVIQIALGLHHAHKNGVIHRDIKPSNVILVDPIKPNFSDTVQGQDAVLNKIIQTNRGQASGAYKKSQIIDPSNRTAKIVDFGLAKSVNEVQDLTQAGTGLGTPKYMSPEHARGIEVDERSDIYSLGCLLFEILAGSVPFRGSTVMETLDLHMQEPPPSLASRGVECSENLEQIVAKCLSKNVGDRFQRAGYLADRLKNELDDIEKARSLQDDQYYRESPSISETPQPEEIARDNKYLKIGLVISLIFIIPAVILMVVHGLNSEQSPQPSKPHKLAKKPALQIDFLDYVPSNEKISKDTMEPNQAGLWSSHGATDEDMAKFLKDSKRNKSIQGFELQDSKLTRAGIKMLADKTKLTSLDFSMQPMTKQNLNNIALISTLKDIRLGGIRKNFEPDALGELTKLKSLEILFIGEMPLNEHAFEAISRIKELVVLELSGCTGITPAGMKHLLKLRALQHLKLDATDADDRSMSVLLSHPLITVINVRDTHITGKLLEQIDKMRNLVSLDVNYNKGITMTEVDRLRKRLKQKGRNLDVLCIEHSVKQIHTEGLDRYTPDLKSEER